MISRRIRATLRSRRGFDRIRLSPRTCRLSRSPNPVTSRSVFNNLSYPIFSDENTAGFTRKDRSFFIRSFSLYDIPNQWIEKYSGTIVNNAGRFPARHCGIKPVLCPASVQVATDKSIEMSSIRRSSLSSPVCFQSDRNYSIEHSLLDALNTMPLATLDVCDPSYHNHPKFHPY